MGDLDALGDSDGRWPRPGASARGARARPVSALPLSAPRLAGRRATVSVPGLVGRTGVLIRPPRGARTWEEKGKDRARSRAARRNASSWVVPGIAKSGPHGPRLGTDVTPFSVWWRESVERAAFCQAETLSCPGRSIARLLSTGLVQSSLRGMLFAYLQVNEASQAPSHQTCSSWLCASPGEEGRENSHRRASQWGIQSVVWF